MKKTFKILLLFISILCLAGLAACGGGNGGEENNGDNNNDDNNNGNPTAITTPEMGTYKYSGRAAHKCHA